MFIFPCFRNSSAIYAINATPGDSEAERSSPVRICNTLQYRSSLSNQRNWFCGGEMCHLGLANNISEWKIEQEQCGFLRFLEYRCSSLSEQKKVCIWGVGVNVFSSYINFEDYTNFAPLHTMNWNKFCGLFLLIWSFSNYASLQGWWWMEVLWFVQYSRGQTRTDGRVVVFLQMFKDLCLWGIWYLKVVPPLDIWGIFVIKNKTLKNYKKKNSIFTWITVPHILKNVFLSGSV